MEITKYHIVTICNHDTHGNDKRKDMQMQIDYYLYEEMAERQKRYNKRLIIVAALLAGMLIVSNITWMLLLL